MKLWDDCTLAQKIERWENVERVLKALTPAQRRREWDMANWGIQTECRTIACAAGHCGLDPWFRRRGFKLKPRKRREGNLMASAGGEGRFESSIYPEGFFGWNGAERIFYNAQPRPVSAVIREVRAYIKELRRAAR